MFITLPFITPFVLNSLMVTTGSRTLILMCRIQDMSFGLIWGYISRQPAQINLHSRGFYAASSTRDWVEIILIRARHKKPGTVCQAVLEQCCRSRIGLSEGDVTAAKFVLPTQVHGRRVPFIGSNLREQRLWRFWYVGGGEVATKLCHLIYLGSLYYFDYRFSRVSQLVMNWS